MSLRLHVRPLTSAEMSEALMKALIYRRIGSWRKVVPETVDAVRALSGGVKDGAISIALTDRALGVRRDFLVRVPEPNGHVD